MVLCTSVHVPNRISHRTFTSLRPFGQYQGEKGLMAYRGPEGFQSDLKALGKGFWEWGKCRGCWGVAIHAPGPENDVKLPHGTSSL